MATLYNNNSQFDKDSLAFHGVRFDVHTVQIKNRSGGTTQRDLVVHPGAVIILPILDKENIILIRNQRFAVNKELWELPAGTLEPGEPSLETAKRELLEETGYRAKHTLPLFNFYTTPGICNEKMFAFLATDLERLEQSLDDSEEISVEIIQWSEALHMIREGKIEDGKTIATLLYYQTFFTSQIAQ